MNQADLNTLVEVFEQADVGWVFSEHPEERAEAILEEIAELEAHYSEVTGTEMPRPLLEQIQSPDSGLKPLVQAFASPMTTPIRTMIYCVLVGATVLGIEFHYERMTEVTLGVVIRTPGQNSRTLPFKSSDAWDVEALRHFGVAKLGGKPIVDGYYAFRAK